MQQGEEGAKTTEENKILLQVQNPSKLILIPQPNGQYLAVPASQIQGAAQAKLPPRASSAPPTEQQVWTHPARPASVDAMGILKSNNNSQRPSPVATPSTPPVAATPPMPTLEPNESLSIRASIDSSSDAERPELIEEVPAVPSVSVTPIPVQNGVHAEVDENEKPEVTKVPKVPVVPATSAKKVLIKSYGVPLLPKPPSMPEKGQNSMTCNVKALVVCKQCGKFCHNDCISSSNVCVSCLIR